MSDDTRHSDSPTDRFVPRFTRFLLTGLILLIVLQIGAVIHAITLPPEVAARLSLPIGWDAVLHAVWAVVFVWAAAAIVRQRAFVRRAVVRAVGLIAAFGVYTIVRLAVFAQTDYDRARLSVLSVCIGGLILLLVVYSRLVFRSAYQNGVRR